jgi:hypothetical protein
VNFLNWVLTLYGWYVALMIALGFFVAVALLVASQATRLRKRLPGQKLGRADGR